MIGCINCRRNFIQFSNEMAIMYASLCLTNFTIIISSYITNCFIIIPLMKIAE